MADTGTERLAADAAGIARAAAILRAGGTVAFPTETVYGLGADAGADAAVAGIYAAKDRPGFNPLIVHVADIATARRLVAWTDAADALAAAFWPGPLTLVLPILPGAPVSRLAAAGLDTLAVRMPGHPVARALLAGAGIPVAAPSANRSGRISPTTAAHVRATLDGRIDAVLDGGPTEVGIESTILGLGGGAPRLLRPGGLPREALEAALGAALPGMPAEGAITAPGQTASHYAPDAALRLDAAEWRDGEARLGFGAVACDLNLSAAGDLREAAANLFAHLHALDAGGPRVIAVSPVPERGLGVAINDRLRRAAAPRP